MAKRLSQAVEIRPATESAKVGINPFRLLIRALLGVAILSCLFLLSLPNVLELLLDRLQTRYESHTSLDTHGGITRGDATLATLFSPEIMYWQEDIIRWGQERGVNPNLIATIIQIESCGHPYVTSNAGAQGLFQVMPLHFEDGENQLNPEQNAQSGIDHLKDCLVWANYDVGVTFACYNGGPSVIGLPYEQWYPESQSYFRWGTGIYNDASQGLSHSPTLDQWLTAGGSNLCQRARFTQDFVMPALASQP